MRKMNKTKIKKEMDELLEELPEEANWNDVMYKIYVRQSIEQGLSDVEEGRIISHKELKSKFVEKLKG
jgi:hypothetical protein